MAAGAVMYEMGRNRRAGHEANRHAKQDEGVDWERCTETLGGHTGGGAILRTVCCVACGGRDRSVAWRVVGETEA